VILQVGDYFIEFFIDELGKMKCQITGDDGMPVGEDEVDLKEVTGMSEFFRFSEQVLCGE